MMNSLIKKAMSLLDDCTNEIENWDERNQFNLKGVKNLSLSDLETISMYCVCICKHGTIDGYLMEPMGCTRDVLKRYGLWN